MLPPSNREVIMGRFPGAAAHRMGLATGLLSFAPLGLRIGARIEEG